MLKIPYEQILKEIKAKTNMADEEIEQQIKGKMDLLSGLISKDGAAHILANELGIKLTAPEGKRKINTLYAGMRPNELTGKVLRKFDVREFQSGDRHGKVGSFIIADETGTIRVTCWHEQTKAMDAVSENDTVAILDGMVKENRGTLEVHLNERSKLLQNPPGVVIEGIKAPTTASMRKAIAALSENDLNIELLGTVVQVFDLKFFERCPVCRKRIREQEAGYVCPEHGAIKPEYSYVMNLYLDDGSGNIRIVLFGQQVQQLLKKTEEELQIFRTAPEAAEKIKTDLLGEMVKMTGKCVKNQMFDRLEFIGQRVETNINPEEEINRLQQELEKGSSMEKA